MTTRAISMIRLIGIATFALSLLAACSAHSPPKVDATRVKEFSGRGYLTDDRFSIATTSASWVSGGHSFDVAWTAPVEGQNLPVVVYLPGLGETRAAGEAWRTAWAQAGYAVLTVQPLAEDRSAWASGAARRGDFTGLAKERYSKDAATARMQRLAALLSETQARRAAADPLFARADFTRLAVAGYDVGAYTAMLAAGETPQGDAAPIHLPIPVAAFIALSPYADFSGSAFSARYQSITSPVLSITGDEDADPLGVVTSPSVRKAPFEYMPSRDGYLLWLADATHATMSGNSSVVGDESGSAAAARGDESPDSRQGGARRTGRRGGNTRGAESGGFGGGRAAASPTNRAMTVALVEGITTAFLDAYVKKDPIALEWLQKDAARWIGDHGEFRRK
jgi:dienelactone hydrolase